MPEEGDDTTADLRSHIDAAHAAADKLVREASERAQRSDEALRERLGDVPARGWDVADAHKPTATPGTSELQVVVGLLAALRDAVPSELSRPVAEAVRELLLAVRALIDWYLDRLDRLPPSRGPGEADDRVQDIPIS